MCPLGYTGAGSLIVVDADFSSVVFCKTSFDFFLSGVLDDLLLDDLDFLDDLVFFEDLDFFDDLDFFEDLDFLPDFLDDLDFLADFLDDLVFLAAFL